LSIFSSLALASTTTDTSVAQEISSPRVREAITAKSAGSNFTVAAKNALLRVEKVWQIGEPVVARGDLKQEGQLGPVSPRSPSIDALLQKHTVIAPTGPQPTIVASFDGISATGFIPPDISAAVGPKHYIQMINAAIAIFDKTGTKLLGPLAINSLWKGFGGPCEGHDAGDPIVRYDRLADRWLVSQFALPDDYQCIAISKGSDPTTSGWFLYAFPTVTQSGTKVYPDYPKIGVWPDGYYMGTQRGFPSSGLDVWVFERDKMLAGQPARQIQFSVAGPSLFLMPSDFDGPPPPKAAPNIFVRHVDGAQFGGQDRLELFGFSTNWSNPAKSTFKIVVQIPTAAFDAKLCGDAFSGVCATQPGTAQKLETLPAWLMWRAQYRNFGSYETLLANHTVNADGKDRAGIRWYELRRQLPNGNWTLYQQDTHSPDAAHRWMGSIAMDGSGNIALGYSVSSDTIFPSIRMAWRRRGDPLGTLSQGELTLVSGSGSQATYERWGDYTTMDVDPALPCTFWYSNEYYATTSDGGWRTRAIAFRIPTCPTSEAQ
jgi:hypothetical protein